MTIRDLIGPDPHLGEDAVFVDERIGEFVDLISPAWSGPVVPNWDRVRMADRIIGIANRNTFPMPPPVAPGNLFLLLGYACHRTWMAEWPMDLYEKLVKALG
jgi:hypothetical protein